MKKVPAEQISRRNKYFVTNTDERQEKSITDDDVVHRDSEALDDNVS